MNQLSRVQPTASNKVDTTARESKVESSGAKEFGDHLDQQIEQSSPLKKPQETQNSDDNQSVSDGELSQQEQLDETEVAPEAVFISQETVSVSSDELLSQPGAEAVEEAGIIPQQGVQLNSDDTEATLQLLSPDGNTLPPAAAVIAPVASDQPVQAQTDEVVRQQAVKLVQPKTSVETIETQTLVKAPLNKAEDVKPMPEAEAFVAPELKLNVKNSEQSFDKILQSRADASPVSKINMATLLQQVPVTTNVATMHAAAGGSMLDNGLAPLPTLSASINTPLQNPAWSQNVAERVNWMVNGNFQNAEIKLNPAHLGPMEIKLSVQDDKASIVFITSHAPVREALDAALPRLREMLEQQGLSLADVDVSDHSADGKEQADSMSDSQARQQSEDGNEHRASLINQSVISVDVSDGINIYA